MRRASTQSGRAVVIGLLVLLLTAALTVCHHEPSPAVVDDISRLSGKIAEALGIARQEARPMASSLVREYGPEAGEVFSRHGLSMADDVDQTIAGIVARAQERSEQSSIISSVACDALTGFLLEGEIPSEESLRAAMAESVIEKYQGQAATVVSHVVATVSSYQSGDTDEASLGVAQILYCDLVAA